MVSTFERLSVLKEKVVFVVEVPVPFIASSRVVPIGNDSLYVSDPTVKLAFRVIFGVDVEVVVATVLVPMSLFSLEKIGGRVTFFITGVVNIVRIFSIGEVVEELSFVRLRGAVSICVRA